MLDIFTFPLYYISFTPKPSLEKHLQNHGYKNIHFFPAIIGKKIILENLVKDNLISIRAFEDLKGNRQQHSGIPSIGAIGCLLSHYMLWKKCIDEKFPYIIIVEDDVKLNKIKQNDINKIIQAITKPNGGFISTKVNKKNNITSLYQLHFCILSYEACKELVDHVFPIDVQADPYIAYLDTIGKINIDGFKIADQRSKITTNSKVQDICVKCILPNNFYFYLIIGIIILSIFFFAIFNYIKLRKCRKQF